MNGYSIILADPAWQYQDAACNDQWRGTPYATLDAEGLAALPVDRLAADDCTLFMWGTYPLLPDVLRVISGWGFVFKSIGFQWVKLNRKTPTPFFGLGRWTRGNTEPCFIATRGAPRPVAHGVSQLVIEPELILEPVTSHSVKPVIVHERIVELMGDLPRIELFARRHTPGWECTGLELDGVDIRELLATLPETERTRPKK